MGRNAEAQTIPSSSCDHWGPELLPKLLVDQRLYVIRSLYRRLVCKMGVSLCGLDWGMAQALADHWEALFIANSDRRKGMVQIVDASIL